MLALRITRLVAITLALVALPYLFFDVPLSLLFGLVAVSISSFMRKRLSGEVLGAATLFILCSLTILTSIAIIWFGNLAWKGFGDTSRNQTSILKSLLVVAGVTLGTIFGFIKSSKYVR